MTSSNSSNKKKCRCGLLAEMKLSKMAKISGKLFMRCSRWKSEDCEFFEWIQETQHDTVNQEEPCRDQHEMSLIIERQWELIKKFLDETAKHTQVSKFNLMCLMCTLVLGFAPERL